MPSLPPPLRRLPPLPKTRRQKPREPPFHRVNGPLRLLPPRLSIRPRLFLHGHLLRPSRLPRLSLLSCLSTPLTHVPSSGSDTSISSITSNPPDTPPASLSPLEAARVVPAKSIAIAGCIGVVTPTPSTSLVWAPSPPARASGPVCGFSRLDYACRRRRALCRSLSDSNAVSAR